MSRVDVIGDATAGGAWLCDEPVDAQMSVNDPRGRAWTGSSRRPRAGEGRGPGAAGPSILQHEEGRRDGGGAVAGSTVRRRSRADHRDRGVVAAQGWPGGRRPPAPPEPMARPPPRGSPAAVARLSPGFAVHADVEPGAVSSCSSCTLGLGHVPGASVRVGELTRTRGGARCRHWMACGCSISPSTRQRSVVCQYLAWLGADVVKVEPPHGEPGRRTGTPDGKAQYFANYNGNKRSVRRPTCRPMPAGTSCAGWWPATTCSSRTKAPRVMEKLGSTRSRWQCTTRR